MNMTSLKKVKSTYVVLLLLFLGSFFIYGFNLAGQPWHGDEITYLGWGGNYFKMIAKGDFGNPCIDSLDNCHMLFHIPAFGLTYSPIRNVLIGLPMYLTNHLGGNFYNWSCYWDCYDSHYGPTVEEMTAGRMLSPLFGSFGVVFSFLIGKNLFNKNFGLITSLIFLFYDLWVWYSRTIMVEVHYVFFALFSLWLLLYSLKAKTPRMRYFVPSAVLFGLALNSKMLAISFSGLFVGIILIKTLSDARKDGGKKKKLVKTSFLMSSFFLMSLLGIFLAEPGFYQDPVNEIKLMKSDMDNYNHDVWYIGYPTIHNLQAKSALSMFHFVILPSFIEQKVSNPSLELNGNFGWTYPPTYSSVPMSIFFFVGLGSAIYYIAKSKTWQSTELLLLIWFASTLTVTLFMVKDFSLERYLLPLEISAIFIASYGVWRFLNVVPLNKIKILSLSLFVLVHSLTSLSYWQKIYFSPGTTWVNPLHYGTLQQSLDNPFVLGADLSFVAYLLLLATFLFKRRKNVSMLEPR